ncbi:unnamed protein product [Acanthoscelides obtectus]|uniref:Uncharacterized protein n=1 Tax=Acanthoscelides obtectus TaxID=200917 RepID=A0A9P0Q262_ACAOB|nr:unnamed protein product [Acanthoscelides obtectus]
MCAAGVPPKLPTTRVKVILAGYRRPKLRWSVLSVVPRDLSELHATLRPNPPPSERCAATGVL